MGLMSNKGITLIIDELMKVKGVSVVALVRKDGVVIESESTLNLDEDTLGALVATSIGASEALASEFSLGEFDVLLSEYTHGKILMATVGNYVLAIFTDKTTVIGSVRYSVKVCFSELISILSTLK